MPGTPPFTSNLAIPRWDGNDGADFPTQYNAGVDRIDAALGNVVTSLPASPVNGQQCLLKVTSAGSDTGTLLWHCIRADGVWYVVGPPICQSTSRGAGTELDSTEWVDWGYSGQYVNAVAPLPGSYFVTVSLMAQLDIAGGSAPYTDCDIDVSLRVGPATGIGTFRWEWLRYTHSGPRSGTASMTYSMVVSVPTAGYTIAASGRFARGVPNWMMYGGDISLQPLRLT